MNVKVWEERPKLVECLDNQTGRHDGNARVRLYISTSTIGVMPL